MSNQKTEMRLVFSEPDVKKELIILAADMEISLNKLVDLIVSAHVSPKHKKILELMLDVVEIKNLKIV